MIFSDQQHIYFQQFQPDHPLLHQNYDPPSISPHSLSSSLPQDFQGISPMLMRRSMSFSGMERCEEAHGLDDEMSDDGGSQLLGDKKRRLNLEQVKGLEKSFELGNKLEPERKMQLARALGLQPRQIAIWFQNRRARSKTKQLERDYDLLKRQYDALKASNDSLKSQNDKLHAELLALKSKEPNSGNRPINLNTETTEGSWSNGSDENSCDHQVNTAGITQIFLQRSSSSTVDNLKHSHERLNQTVGDGTFCSMFNGMDDNHGFWSWPEQNQTFH